VQLETLIFEALATGSPLPTSAGVRVYPEQAKQGAATPRITYSIVTTVPQNNLGGNSGLDLVRVQVDCWADSSPAAATLATEVRAVLEAQPFKALLQNSFTAYEHETKTFRRSLDFRCWHRPG
jgi:hypothetical protein